MKGHLSQKTVVWDSFSWSVTSRDWDEFRFSTAWSISGALHCLPMLMDWQLRRGQGYCWMALLISLCTWFSLAPALTNGKTFFLKARDCITPIPSVLMFEIAFSSTFFSASKSTLTISTKSLPTFLKRLKIMCHLVGKHFLSTLTSNLNPASGLKIITLR